MARKKTPEIPLQRGELIVIEWLDIQQDPVGEATEADLAVWLTPGYWYGIEVKRGIECVIAMDSLVVGDRGHHQNGWICIPRMCVKSIRRLVEG